MTTTVRGFRLPSVYGVELPILWILLPQLLVMKADVHDVEPPDICRCVQRCSPLRRTFGGSGYDSRAVTCDVTMGEYLHGLREIRRLTTVSRRIGTLRPVRVTLRSAVPHIGSRWKVASLRCISSPSTTWGLGDRKATVRVDFERQCTSDDFIWSVTPVCLSCIALSPKSLLVQGIFPVRLGTLVCSLFSQLALTIVWPIFAKKLMHRFDKILPVTPSRHWMRWISALGLMFL